MTNRSWLALTSSLGLISLACAASSLATPPPTLLSPTATLAPTPTQAGDTILAVFPLGGGATWTYHAVIDDQSGAANEVQHWEGEISAAIGDTLLEGLQTFFRVDWSGNPISWVQPQESRYYVPLGGKLYEAESEETARALIAANGVGFEMSQRLAWPLSAGEMWGDPAQVAQNVGGKYVWLVMESVGVVQVPAGTFNDCYSLAFVTNPDRSFRTFCPGVGFVRYEYAHHGTLHNEIWELTTFEPAQQP